VSNDRGHGTGPAAYYGRRVEGLESTLITSPSTTRDLSECRLRVTAAYRILFDVVDRAAYNVWTGVDAVQ
jgi:hypothetical protein